MDVEHFIPQMENPALVYEWTNLFPANAPANAMMSFENRFASVGLGLGYLAQAAFKS